MPRLSLPELEAGMVLAQDVRDGSGRVLLSAGNEIQEKHLKIFKTWGIASAEIDASDLDMDALEGASKIDPKTLDAAKKKAELLFVLAENDHPAMKELLQIATNKIARLLSKDVGDES